MKRILKKFSLITIAIIYIFTSLIIGEFHPFSKFPMYSSFPNWSYSFFLTDSNNKFIPFNKFNMSGGEMGHWFYSICENKKIQYGNGMESRQELNLVGNEMIELMFKKNKYVSTIAERKNIKLYRLFCFYSNDTIQKKYYLMYDGNVK